MTDRPWKQRVLEALYEKEGREFRECNEERQILWDGWRIIARQFQQIEPAAVLKEKQ